MNDRPTVGTRVRLVSCSDPYTHLPAGAYGTVRFVDDVGTVHVAWDNGAQLGMVRGYDRYEVVSEPSAPSRASVTAFMAAIDANEAASAALDDADA